MQVYTDVESLESYLADLAGTPPLVLGIERASTSGKTALAGKLAEGSEARVVSTDSYYKQGVLGDRYQDGLRLEDLRQDLIRLRSESDRLIIEGICLRDTLDVIGQELDLYVYCKRVSTAGVWNDDPDFEDSLDPNSGFTQERIDWWSHQYHRHTRPHEIADIVFEWREDAF